MNTNVWLPPSHEFRGLAAARKAAKEYDANLDFGRNEKTGQWCVFIRHGTMPCASEGDFPVLGFQDIPDPGLIQRRLYESDAQRHNIVAQIQRHNSQLEKERDKISREKSAELAEHMEWGFRKMDSDKAPTRKVFFTGKDKDASA